MRLGGNIFKKCKNPNEWIAELKRFGYSAATCPLDNSADEKVVMSYMEAAKRANIVIAEVGAWSNPISPDEKTRKSAVEYCKKQLAFADRIGAVCCVNTSGSRSKNWDGPDKKNLTKGIFALIVGTVKEIIDEARPKRAFYTLEPMPWVYPDSVDSYVRLVKAIDRKQFAVHLDPVNMINSPEKYFKNDNLLRECFSKLGPYIKSCHAKDIYLSNKLTLHLEEVVPGKGELDYKTYLAGIEKINPDMPLIIEHFTKEEDYLRAAKYIKAVARQQKINIK